MFLRKGTKYVYLGDELKPKWTYQAKVSGSKPGALPLSSGSNLRKVLCAADSGGDCTLPSEIKLPASLSCHGSNTFAPTQSPTKKPTVPPSTATPTSYVARETGVKNIGKGCWGQCGRKSGKCSFCGTGKCCRKGWRGGENGCAVGEGGWNHACVGNQTWKVMPNTYCVADWHNGFANAISLSGKAPLEMCKAACSRSSTCQAIAVSDFPSCNIRRKGRAIPCNWRAVPCNIRRKGRVIPCNPSLHRWLSGKESGTGRSGTSVCCAKASA